MKPCMHAVGRLVTVLAMATWTLAYEEMVAEVLAQGVEDGDLSGQLSGIGSGSKVSRTYRAAPPLIRFPSSEEVETEHVLLDVQDLRFPLGRESTVLCHVRNKGGPLNVTFMRGSLNFPFDFSIQLVELSSEPVNIQIPADGEATLEYPFMIRADLNPIDYQMAHTVFYQNDKGSFSSTFFNKTVDLYQPPVEDSSGGMMRSLLGGLAFLLAAFITFKRVTGATNETVPLRPTGTGTSDWGGEYLGQGKKGRHASKQKRA